MDPLPATAAAAALFAGTNIDDLFVIAVLSASSRATGSPRRWQVWAGQYAGIAVLVAVSAAAGRGLALVPEGWLWLLGLVPLGLGIGRLAAAIRAHRRGGEAPAPAAAGVPGVAGLTISNGGDNIAAYTPVFATSGPGAAAITVAVFAAGVALWCLAGSWLVSHHRVTEELRRRGHWIIPVVYILVGLYIFQKTGLFTRHLTRLSTRHAGGWSGRGRGCWRAARPVGSGGAGERPGRRLARACGKLEPVEAEGGVSLCQCSQSRSHSRS